MTVQPIPATHTGVDAALTAAFQEALSGQIVHAAIGLRKALQDAPVPAGSLTAHCLALFEGFEHIVRGDYGRAVHDMMLSLPAVERSHFNTQLAWVYSAIGFALGTLGDPAKGLEWTARAIALADRENQALCSMRARSDRGCLFGMLDDFEAAIGGFESALELAVSLGSLHSQASCLTNLAFTELARARRCRESGQLDAEQAAVERALLWSERACERAFETEIEQVQAWSLTNRMHALTRLGKYDQAAAVLTRARPLAAAFAHIRLELSGYEAVLLGAQGHYDAAGVLLEQARIEADSLGLDTIMTGLLESTQWLAESRGDIRGALRWSGMRIAHIESHFHRRLKSIARSAELFVEAEQARLNYEASLKREQLLKQEAAQWQDQSQQWRDAALRDTLTGVYNRRGLEERVNQIWQDTTPLAVAILDADHFKRVNDTLGHAVGDQVLQRLAAVIGGCCRGADVLARVGGEEFVLVLVDVDRNRAALGCERIRAAVEGVDWSSIAINLAVTVSIGLAQRRRADCSFDELLALADTALYAAKSGGRNKVQAS